MQRLRDLNPLHERFGYLSLVAAGVVVLLLGLLLRSDFFLNFVDFVLELLGWAAVLAGLAIAIAGLAAYGSERGWWSFSGGLRRSVRGENSYDTGGVRLSGVSAGSSVFLPALDDHQLF